MDPLPHGAVAGARLDGPAARRRRDDASGSGSAVAGRRRDRLVRTAAAGALVVMTLAACAPGSADAPVAVSSETGSDLHGTEIGDVIARPALSLPTTDGQAFDLQQRPDGEVTALFFGYTRCPDVCPTALADLAAARRQLPPQDAERLQVAFVTEDPAHDTPAVLEQWLERFDPSFLGLVGGGEATTAALDALKAPRTEVVVPGSAAPHPTDGPHAGHSHTNGAGETVEHTGSVYVFAGDRVVVYTGGTTPQQYAEDVEDLLSA